MKTIRKALFILVIIVICSSCFSPWGGDTGTFSISIGGSGSGRTVLPWNEDIQIEKLEHVITLKGPGPEQTISVKGAKTVHFSVVPGLWNITIKAYNGVKKDENLVAVGSNSVDIKPGSNGPITIRMGLIEMVWVAGGSFQMGDDGYSYSSPVHTVTLTGFYIGKYEVTQAQYQAVMGTNPSSFTSDADEGEVQEKRPVENVTWYDAIEFCNKLSSLEGLTPVYTITGRTPEIGSITSAAVTPNWNNSGYRLPTEAQWEYAAKGGPSASVPYKIYSGSDNAGEVAWYSNNSGYKTHEVGKLAPNELGLYDMSGNVWEWCWDWLGSYTSEDQTNPTGPASGYLRIQRGGGLDNDTTNQYGNIRSAYRKGYGEPHINLGFRVVRPAQSSVEPGAPGLAYELINNDTAYRVSRGTATGDIVIPAWYNGKPVTTISNGADDYNSNAFGGTEKPDPGTYNTTVTSITFAAGSQLTTISSHAFYRCTNLTSIILPESLTSIGECAFERTSLTGITIPAGVTEIGRGTFYLCSSLNTVNFAQGSKLAAIGYEAFEYCTSLTSIAIPAGVTSIGYEAFSGCTSLASVTFAGTIAVDQFNTSAFPGDLRTKYLAGGIGTYTRNGSGTPDSPYVWTKR